MAMNRSMMSMDTLTELSDSLKGLTNLKLNEDGRYIFVTPTQILNAPKGSVALDEFGGISNYAGLPELIMAEDFTGIKPTLEKDYTNHKNSREVSGVFEYDLNMHLIDNILAFREKIKTDGYLESLDESVKNKIMNGQLYEDDGGERVLSTSNTIVGEDRVNGRLIDFIKKYKTDVVFYADPVISVKVQATDQYPRTLKTEKTIETEEESKLYGVPVGSRVRTPLDEASKLYLWAFSKLYEQPLYDKYPEMERKAIREMAEFSAIQEKKLVQPEKYKVMHLLNRIPTNNRGDIEADSIGDIPSFLGRMSVSSNMFKKIYEVDKDSKANYEPSFRVIRAMIPKAKAQNGPAIGRQYMEMEFIEPGIVGSDVLENNSNPFLHKVDKEYSKRIKEASLNFRFKESFVTRDSNALGENVTLAELNEMIRQILTPMYKELENNEELEAIKDRVQSFMTDKLGVDIEEKEEEIKDAQFSGLPQPPTN